MTFTDKMKRLQSVCSVNYWAHRIYAELCYMTCLSSTKDGIYDGRIEEACDYLIGQLGENHSIIRPDALHVEEMLSDLSADAKSLTVHCVSHAHIDMNWMWGYQETASVAVDTFRTILNLMEDYPSFTFAQSQASTYNIIEKFAPEMLPAIRKHVHEGRWDVTASAWTETDKNMPNGESLSRHILYTKNYLGNLLEIDPDSIEIDFSPDTFGHNANEPEICAKGGLKYYYHMRANDIQEDLYRWRSKSGSEILVFRDSQAYNGSIDIRTFENIPLFCKKNKTDCHLFVYGVGDHGGGPTRNDVERLIDDASFPLYPNIIFSTFHRFFKEAEKFKENFPVIEREINYVFTGCYTTQTRIKMSNRIAEDRSYEAEEFAAAANLLTGAAPRNELFEKSWRATLFNHFHDILPGSGVIETREYALGQFQEGLAGINIAANTAMRNIADAIDTTSVAFDENNFTTAEGGGVGFAVSHDSGYRFPQAERGRGNVRVLHLFNSTMYDRDEPVEVTVWDYNYDKGLAYFTDSEGNEVESELMINGSGYWGHNFSKFLVHAKIPAFGYSTYILKLREYNGTGCLASAATGGWCDTFGDYPYVLENSKLKAVFDPTTLMMTELTDKVSGKKIVTPDKPSALFSFIKENPRFGMTSWRVGPYMSVDNLNGPGHMVRLTDYGVTGMRRWVSYEVRFEKSKINVTAELRGENDIINFHIDADWHETGSGDFIPQLNFTLPVSYDVKNYEYDIPMGTIERDDIPHDVPGNSFMRICGGERSAFIVTDTKYGFRGHNNCGGVTLIRSSCDPDPYPELGVHHINIGVGVCGAEEQKKEAVKFVHPVSFNAGTKHGGSLPMNGSIGAIAGLDDTLMISGIKNAEDGGIIVRVADFGGKSGKVKLTVSDLVPAPASASLVDITEKHVLSECTVNGREIEFDIEPFAMATLLIK